MSDNDDHAQVWALLAKCNKLSINLCKHDVGSVWVAHAEANGLPVSGIGPTQLAATRAAVEVSEQGVRE